MEGQGPGGSRGRGGHRPSKDALLSAAQISLVSQCFVALVPLYSVYPEINKPGSGFMASRVKGGKKADTQSHSEPPQLQPM